MPNRVSYRSVSAPPDRSSVTSRYWFLSSSDHRAGCFTRSSCSQVPSPPSSTVKGAPTALPTALPEGSSTVEVTVTFCPPAPWFSTSVRIRSVASPGRTWARTRVPHFFTCTGFVFTSHACR